MDGAGTAGTAPLHLITPIPTSGVGARDEGTIDVIDASLFINNHYLER